MSNAQAPAGAVFEVPLKRLRQLWLSAITPHSSITDLNVEKRARLLNTIALILGASFVVGLLSNPSSYASFEFMLAVSVISYLFGKSKRPEIGKFVFSFGFTSTSFLSLYLGIAGDFTASILSITPVALITAGALVSDRVFIGLVIFTGFAAFFAPLYSAIPISDNEVMRNGGIITTIGLVLYGINIFRAYLEAARVKEINAANRHLLEFKSDSEKRAQEYENEIKAIAEQAERQTARLNNLAEISQKISANVSLPLNDLLTSATETISDKLGFYHVGIFLLDKNRQYAELRAANSKGGQRMLERKHQLKVGGTGIVGYVAQSGFPRIALSTGADAVFFNNPDLPDTRSEMALPLKVGNLVLGVLDVQSPLPAAFSKEDEDVFNALANQLAFVVMQAQSEDILALRSAKKAAEAIAARDKEKGYTYFADGTIAAAKEVKNPALEKALKSGKPIALPARAGQPSLLAVPVKIRDNVVGYIHVEAENEKKKWSEDEVVLVQSVSERAALALENSRLFEETERRAEQEQVLTQVTNRIGESSSFERILQITIQELGRTLQAKRAYIQMEALSHEDQTAGGVQ